MAQKKRCRVCGRRKGLQRLSLLSSTGREFVGVFCGRCAGLLKEQGQRHIPAVDSDPGVTACRDMDALKRAMNRIEAERGGLRQTYFLWDFPEQDFPLWSRLQEEEHGLPFGTVNTTYYEYQGNLLRLKQELEGRGHRVVLVRATVQEMMNVCQEMGMPYNTRARTEAVQLLGARQLSEGGEAA